MSWTDRNGSGCVGVVVAAGAIGALVVAFCGSLTAALDVAFVGFLRFLEAVHWNP